MIIQQHCLISTLQYSGMVLYTHFSHYIYEVKVGYRIYTASGTLLPSILGMALEPQWEEVQQFTAPAKYMDMVELIRWAANSKESLYVGIDSVTFPILQHLLRGLRSCIYHSRSGYGACIAMFSYCNYLLQTYHAHAVENLALLYLHLTFECYSSMSDKG